MKKKGLFFKLFGQAVKDKSPEEIEQLALDAAAAFDEDGEAAKEEKEDEKKETGKKEMEDESTIDGIVDKVMARMAAKKSEKETTDSLDAAITKLTGDSGEPASSEGLGDEGASHVIPAEEVDKNCGMDKALAAEILKAMRPSVAAINDAAQRKAVSDALINFVTSRDQKNDVAAILQASQKNAQVAADNRPKAMDNDAIQALYDNLNPHRRKENK